MSRKQVYNKSLNSQPTCTMKVNACCARCQKKVRRALQKIDGVDSVTIDEEEGEVIVAGDADPALLVKKLKKAGKHADLLSANGGGVGRVEEHGGEGSKEQTVVQRQERQQWLPEDPLQGRGGRFRDMIKFPFFSSRKGKKTVTFGLAPKKEDYDRSNLATFDGRDGVNDGNGQGGRSRREGEGEKDKNDENSNGKSVSSQGSNSGIGVAQEKNIPAAYGGVPPGHQLGDVVAPGMMAG